MEPLPRSHVPQRRRRAHEHAHFRRGGRPARPGNDVRSDTGTEAQIFEWGAVIRDLTIPLGQGRTQRVVLGLNSLDDYIRHSPYFGAIAGRYGNRIAQERLRLGDE